MLDLMSKGKRILNIDQTPLLDSNFVVRGWMPRSINYSKKIHVVSPHITMMTAIDSYGDLYWTLLQANSDSETMELVLNNLVSILDKERPGWRKDTVL